jgi:hypothetical protein
MNAIFIIVMFISLVGLDYAYTIGDDIVAMLNEKFTEMGLENPISTAALESYVGLRSMMYGIVTGVMTPFLLMLSFGSSFINRNQTVISYTVQVIAIVFMTPLIIYAFAELLTNLLAVNILDPAYIAQSYFDNFLLIMVLNMLFGLASFVFVQRGVVYEA